MSEQIDSAIDKLGPVLNSIANELANLYTTGKEFAKDEVPQLAKEIIHFGAADAGMFMFLGSLFIVAAALLFRVGLKEAKKEYGNSEMVIFSYVGSVVSACIGLIVFFCNLHTLLMTVFSPRLYLIKEAVTLVAAMKGGHCH